MQLQLDYRCGGSAGFKPASRYPDAHARDHLAARATYGTAGGLSSWFA